MAATAAPTRQHQPERDVEAGEASTRRRRTCRRRSRRTRRSPGRAGRRKPTTTFRPQRQQRRRRRRRRSRRPSPSACRSQARRRQDATTIGSSDGDHDSPPRMMRATGGVPGMAQRAEAVARADGVGCSSSPAVMRVPPSAGRGGRSAGRSGPGSACVKTTASLQRPIAIAALITCEEADHEAAQRGAGRVADAAQHGRGEGLTGRPGSRC